MPPNDVKDWTAPGQGVEVLDQSLNHASASGSFQLPAGTQSVVVVTTVQAGDQADLNMTGHQTGFGYYGAALGSGAYEIIGMDQQVDQQIDWSAQSVNGPGTSWHVTALPVPPPSFISRLPSPWQVPTKSAGLNVVIAAGTTTTWITGIAGRRIRLFNLWGHWRTATAGFGQLKGGGTTGLMQSYDQVATNFFSADFGGDALDFGEAFQISNDDVAVGTAIHAGVRYSLD